MFIEVRTMKQEKIYLIIVEGTHTQGKNEKNASRNNDDKYKLNSAYKINY